MDDTIIMQVLNSQSNLVCDLLYSFFSKFEVPDLDVVEKILASHVL